MPTVTINPSLQVTGMTLMAPPIGNTFPRGIRATAIPTVLPPPPRHVLADHLDDWSMDHGPKRKFVLVLDGTTGLSLYQVSSGNPTSGSFEGDAVFGPAGGGGAYFCAQADGNAVVYDSSFPQELNVKWHANNGTSGSAQYLFVQENGCFVTIQSMECGLSSVKGNNVSRKKR